MYQLHVFYPSEPRPRVVEHLMRGDAVLARVQVLVVEHSGCSHVAVIVQGAQLFQIDCDFNLTR